MKIIASKGTGYWDLTHYPWGGDFRRFKEDTELIIIKTLDTYKDGKPRNVIAKSDIKLIGFTL